MARLLAKDTHRVVGAKELKVWIVGVAARTIQRSHHDKAPQPSFAAKIPALVENRLRLPGNRPDPLDLIPDIHFESKRASDVLVEGKEYDQVIKIVGMSLETLPQIGRASCREREK